MKITDIKPIPKYILALIRKKDMRFYQKPDGHNRFYAYLTVWHKELVKVTVAVRHYKKQWYCKQVAFHGIHSDKCFVKDIEYCGFVGMGFRVGWYDEGLQNAPKWFENGVCFAKDKYYDPWAPIVNLDVLEKFPEYKYSAYKQYPYCTLFKFLRLYEQYPQAEYLVKLRLFQYATSKMILRRLANNLRFRRWFLAHKDEIRQNRYYVGTILAAFSKKRPLRDVQEENTVLKRFATNKHYKNLRPHFKKDALKLMRYIEEKGTNPYSYYDYYRACEYLELDMTEDKNRYPHDFQRWHDIRTDQYRVKKAEQDEKERQLLVENFTKVAQKYITLQHDKRGAFVCFIAQTPAELVAEGNHLHHCVGRMNYDMRVAREESLIFFIRHKDNPTVPFVTVEYSPSNHKVLQCYGEHDSRPNEKVLHYVNKVWLPYANRQLKQIAA